MCPSHGSSESVSMIIIIIIIITVVVTIVVALLLLLSLQMSSEGPIVADRMRQNKMRSKISGFRCVWLKHWLF